MQNEKNSIIEKNYTLEELQDMINEINHSQNNSLINKIYKITRKKYLDTFKTFELHPITKEEYQKRKEEQETLKKLYNKMILRTEKIYTEKQTQLLKDKNINSEVNQNEKHHLYKKRTK